jgi:hypothetical protein
MYSRQALRDAEEIGSISFRVDSTLSGSCRKRLTGKVEKRSSNVV